MAPVSSALHDQQLLAQVADGDLQAFAALYDRHAPRLLGLIQGIVHNLADAEDVLQEVFAQVWDRAGGYDPERSQPLFWLGLVARSRALDQLRRMRRRGENVDVLAEAGGLATAAEVAELQESATLVGGVLGRLPREQSEVIRLAYYRGLTHAEIARLSGLPLGTVKTRIRLGMQRMREILDQMKVSA